MLKKIICYLVYKVKKIYLRNFSYELWNIGIMNAAPDFLLKSKSFNSSKITWLPPHKRYAYYADPFPYIHKGNFYIFAEDLSYFNKRGKICRLQVNPSSGEVVGKKEIFRKDYHYSYPCIFSYEKETYMLPETVSKKELALYKAVDFPDAWQKERVIFSKRNIIDATIFYYDNYFWLFYTTKSKIHPKDSELHIAYSRNLQSSFKDHPGNPVKVDSSSSRPAGNIFVHKGKLYRPAQDCSKTYGGNLVINEIVKLSVSEYTEKQINKISMENHPYYNKGIHTVNFAGEYMVFDAKTRIYSPFRIFVNLIRKLRRFFRFFAVKVPIP